MLHAVPALEPDAAESLKRFSLDARALAAIAGEDASAHAIGAYARVLAARGDKRERELWIDLYREVDRLVLFAASGLDRSTAPRAIEALRSFELLLSDDLGMSLLGGRGNRSHATSA